MEAKASLEVGDRFVFHGTHWEFVGLERCHPTDPWVPVVRRKEGQGFTEDLSHREVR